MSKVLSDPEKLTQIFQASIQDAILRHKLKGNPVCEGRDNKIVWIPPEDIPFKEIPLQEMPESFRLTEAELKKISWEKRWNSLTKAEFNRSRQAENSLKEISRAKDLLAKPLIQKALDDDYLEDKEEKIQELLKNEQKIKQTLFEVRFAEAIHRAGFCFEYEASAHNSKKSIDFKIDDHKNKRTWLVELTSLENSKAVKEDTHQVEGEYRVFSSITTPWDKKNSVEAQELIKAQRAILSKVGKFSDLTATKDSPYSAYHVIIIDMRGFLCGVSDYGDYLNILYGSENIPDEYKIRWIDNTGEKRPIVGIFKPDHPDPHSQELQNRVHAVGFINEKTYEENELKNGIKLYCNPRFFSSHTEIREIWPLTSTLSSLSPTLSDAEIEDLINQRMQSRTSKDFASSDRIRDDLASQGIILEDTPQGTLWRRQ